MRHRLTGPLLVTTAALVLAGCGSSDSSSSASSSSAAKLSVKSAYMPQPVTDSLAAGYLVIENDGGAADELTSVTSDIARDVTVHETTGQSMREVTGLKVPADGELVLKSGGNHLMFENLKRKPKEGETVSLRLNFTKSEAITVEMPVKSATYQPTNGH
ncbi:copper chaperone PCu(A)C [Streptomyces europaeiscabiei]|uniref:Copper chaperone PCu(A)C n=1 Tax=Streptomyces europaeiscabiei TaxID=146819 RepID=A0ABU4NIA9_9ACTN|nr:copper chaperone PCu(A)C [Streptomyces europaeiscabiei]MDX2527828.1 copper chaperone PCu(A)C [Streptomyces europaeiscabiei]MDX2757458.1 copper chaperone PCu(A)C [Streptomyces europaeiscabiei]MDX3544906.1 copper chaperone PCu(A)C [Streptomyces europaeiscabiei]MDX3554594.1 copper chaperone PCu(A)C [Streptomyces europaeiscabiei]MDX3702504.1 copper chaperone PCu(A)C [Streptomyces europaeiscabiei]